MKVLSVVVLILLSFTSPASMEYALDLFKSFESKPILSFDTLMLNSDTLLEGQVYKFIYRFENTGTSPLILYSVKSSCGCYVPQWPKDPISPGARDSVIGVYSSRGRPGRFVKSMTVKSNDPRNPTIMLQCKGYTIPKTNY